MKRRIVKRPLGAVILIASLWVLAGPGAEAAADILLQARVLASRLDDGVVLQSRTYGLVQPPTVKFTLANQEETLEVPAWKIAFLERISARQPLYAVVLRHVKDEPQRRDLYQILAPERLALEDGTELWLRPGGGLVIDRAISSIHQPAAPAGDKRTPCSY